MFIQCLCVCGADSLDVLHWLWGVLNRNTLEGSFWFTMHRAEASWECSWSLLTCFSTFRGKNPYTSLRPTSALLLGRNFPGSPQISLALTSACQSNSSSTCRCSVIGSPVWRETSRSLLHSSHQKQVRLLKPPGAWFPVVFVIEDHTSLYKKL